MIDIFRNRKKRKLHLSVFVAEVFVVKVFEAPQSVGLRQGSVNERLLRQVNASLEKKNVGRGSTDSQVPSEF